MANVFSFFSSLPASDLVKGLAGLVAALQLLSVVRQFAAIRAKGGR